MLNRWQRTIVDLRGNVVPYAQLQIRVESTQATATIYADRAGNELIPNGIVTADANGYAFFYAKADLYRISSTQPTIDWRDVDVGSAAAQQLAQQALDNAVPTYETLVDMQADTNQPVPTLGRVVNDSTLENNGYYVWTGAAWDRAAYQHLSEMDVSIEPAPSKIPRATGDGVIREAWVEDLPFNYNQIYAQLWSARYPGIPAPSFYQEFGGGASLLDPRITFTRSGTATYIKNGRLLTAGVDEPVFEDGGLRVWPSVTNLIPYSNRLDLWPSKNGFSLEEIGADGDLLTWRALVSHPQSIALLYINNVLPDVDGKNYTYTCYVKRAESFEGGFWVGNHNTQTGKWSVGINADGSVVPLVNHGEVLNLEYDSETGFLSFTFEAEEGTDTRVYLRADTSGAQIGDPVFEIGNQMVVESSAINPYVPTNGQPETMPADNASIQGAAFQKIFNPQEGAWVFKIGEGSVLNRTSNASPYYGLALYDTQHSSSGFGVFFLPSNSGGVIDRVGFNDGGDQIANALGTFSAPPGSTLGLRWQGDTIALFLDGVKHNDYTNPRLIAALAGATGMRVHRNLGIYFDHLSLFTTAPTDAQMEALTNA